jgi:hypothetical protein
MQTDTISVGVFSPCNAAQALVVLSIAEDGTPPAMVHFSADTALRLAKDLADAGNAVQSGATAFAWATGG